MGYFFCFTLIVGVILFFYNSKRDEASLKENRNIAIRNKFIFYIDYLNSINIKYKEYELTVDKITLSENITNGISIIGRIYYIIEDKYEIIENTVGKYKNHRYKISIVVKIEPANTFYFSSDIFYNKEDVGILFKKVYDEFRNNKSYLDAIKINEI